MEFHWFEERSEKIFFILFPIVLLSWFSFGYFAVRQWLAGNILIGFLIIFELWLFVQLRFIQGIKIEKDIPFFISFSFGALAFDIISIPYLVVPGGLASADVYALMSSDVFFYKLLGLGGWVGYLITYVVIPTLLVIGSYFISGFSALREVLD